MTFLPANGRFDAASAFDFLLRHAIPGVDVVHPASRQVTRLVGPPGERRPVSVRLRPDGVELELGVGSADAGSGLGVGSAEPGSELVALVRRWFDLDTDLTEIGVVLDRDPLLIGPGRRFPGLRILGSPDGFETSITTVLGQQVSLAAMRTFAGRLAATYGTSGPGGLTVFPTPERLAEAVSEELRAAVGITRSRARTVQSLAGLFAGGFSLDAEAAPDHLRDTLLALPGVGPWTVDYLAMRVLRDPDACPAGDLVFRRALGVERIVDVAPRVESWRPFRAYGVIRLWTEALAATRPPPAGR